MSNEEVEQVICSVDEVPERIQGLNRVI